MAYITKKKVKGQVYYYAVESQRVNGKPRVVWQRYLGKVQDLVKRLEAAQPPAPQEALTFEFGAVAALYHIARRLQVVDTINAHVTKRHQGLSVGEYMLIAAINRAVAPTSKRQIGEWFGSTSLRRWIPIQPERLTSQRFWDHMGYLGEEEIRATEADLVARLATEFQLDLRALLYDATNFFTYIDSMTAAQLPQRGHNKAKRHDLRQVGLALLVTIDFHIPLLHQVYPGNDPDAVQFGNVTDVLVARYQLLSQHCQDITLIFDKGNNSQPNISELDQSPYHFVGSLTPSQYADLLAIPREQFQPLQHPKCAGVWAHRTRRQVFGQERTVVVTYSEDLYQGQVQGFTQHLRKAVGALRDLQQRLLVAPQRRGVSKITKASVQQQVRRICSAQHVRDVLKVSITEESDYPQITYTVDHQAQHQLAQRLFGKTILFTDQDDWSTEAIVTAYRGQAAIEDAFKRMKDPHFLRWSPLFHWTDQKIRVHAFYCVLALTLTALLRRELHRHGIDISIPALLETLSGIQEVALIYPTDDGKRLKAQTVLTRRSPLQQKIIDALGLDCYWPC